MMMMMMLPESPILTLEGAKLQRTGEVPRGVTGAGELYNESVIHSTYMVL